LRYYIDKFSKIAEGSASIALH